MTQNDETTHLIEFEKPKSIRTPNVTRHYNFDDSAIVASVVLVNFNHGHYLKEAINSIVNQTYPNIEIIVIDGGSVDNSKEILQAHPGIKWISEADNNSGHAFVKGIQLATGKFVYFLTATDGFFDDDWVKKSVESFRNDEDLALVSADVIGVRKNSILNGYKWPKGNPVAFGNEKLFFNWLFGGIGFTPVSFVIRREVLEVCAPKIEMMLDLNNSESVDFFWHLIGNFFSSGFIGIKLPMVSTFVRFHGDRIDDAAYLPRQSNVLHRIIVNRRRQLLLSRKPAIFVSPLGQTIASESIPYKKIVTSFFLAKLHNLLTKTKRDSYELD